jgi:general stress protein 26
LNEEEIKKQIASIMEKSEAVFVSTIDEKGNPDIRAMFNLRRKMQFPKIADIIDDYYEKFVTFLSTNTSSSKINQMKLNPNIALYFYVTKERLKGVTLYGKTEFIEDEKIKKDIWEDDWDKYYPQGLKDPDYTLIKFNPKKAKFYSALQIHTLQL